MSIEISASICVGCAQCAEICPGSLIAVDAEKGAFIRSPERCWGCASCIKECPNGAIRLYLGRDIGGQGGLLSALREGTKTHWRVDKPDGEAIVITVDSLEANHY